MRSFRAMLFSVAVLALSLAASEARADLNISVSPTPVSIGQGEMGAVTINSQILAGFPANASSIEYTLTSFPQGTGIGVAQTFAPAFGPTNLSILVNSSTPPGTYTAAISSVVKDAGGNVVGTKDFPGIVTVNVTATACDFEVMSDPATLRVQQGTSVELSVFASIRGGCSGVFSFSASAPAGVTVDSPRTTNAPDTRVTFTYTAAATAPPGQFSSTVTVQGGGVTHSITVPIEVVAPAGPQGDYGVVVMPNPISIGTTGRQNFTFVLTSTGGFQGPVTVTIGTSGQVVVLDKGCPSGTFCPYQTATYTVPANGSVSEQAIASSTGPQGGTIVLLTTTPGLPDKHTEVIVTSQPEPDFRLNTDASSITLAPGASRDVQLSGSSINSFTGLVNVVGNAPGDLTIDPGTFDLTLPGPKFAQAVRFSASPGAAPGTYAVVFTGTSGGLTRNVTVNVTVTALPDFTITATAPAAPVVAGQTAQVRVAANGTNGFNTPIAVTAFATGGTVTPSSFTLAPGESRDVAVTINGTTGGNVTVTFNATTGTIQKSAAVSVPFVSATQPDFTLTVSPPNPGTPLQPNDSATVTVTIIPQHGFNSAVTITVTAPPGVIAMPAQFTMQAGTLAQTVQLTAAAGAAPGPQEVTFTANATSPAITRSASVTITTIAARPRLQTTAVTPAGAVVGTQSLRAAISGVNFAPGARASSADPRIIIGGTEVASSNTAVVDVTVDLTTPPGRYALTLRNPDGDSGSVDFYVYEEGDIATPLGVTSAAILSPVAGKIISMFDRPHAVGAVAATGTGTITGRWLLDGATFDQFAITVSAGDATIVMSRQPIPYSFIGRHRLQLVIDSPQYAQSAELGVEMATESASNLTILGPVPTAGTATSNEPLTLRWSLVPGALGYRVEIEKNGEPFGEPLEAGQEGELTLGWNQLVSERDDPRRPSASRTFGAIPAGIELEEIRRSRFRWRVAPMYCCSGDDPYAGQRSEWAELPVPAVIEPEVHLDDDARLRAVVAAVTPELAMELSARGDARIAEASQKAGRPAATVPPKSRVRKDWLVTPSLNATYNHQAEEEQAIVQMSGKGDMGIAPFSSKYTTDFTGRDILGDSFTFTGSRNWLINVGNAKNSKRALRPEVAIGYAPPRFFTGSQLVSTSMARGGALVSLASRFGTASYYSTFTDALEGVIPGNFGMRQKVAAAAFELPANRRYSLKFLHLHVEDLPDSRQRTFTRGEGDSLGIYGTLNVGRRLQVTAEAARGDGEWQTSNGVREREGNAFRIGLNGMQNRLNWRAELSRTDSEFSKPGDRFSTMATPNRTIGSLSLSSPVGKGQATVMLRHQLQTKSSTDATASGLNVMYNRPFTQRITLSANGNYNLDQGGGRPEIGLPRLDRRQFGGSVTLNETFRRLMFSQSFEHREVRDGIHTSGTSETDMVTLSANGAVTTWFQLGAMTTLSRMSGTRPVGENDNVSVSITPSFTIPRTGLSLAPRVSWNLASSSASDSRNRSEDYASILQWNPGWLSKSGSLQLSTNWRRGRNSSAYMAEKRTMTREYVGTFTMRWGAGIGPATLRRGQTANAPIAQQVVTSQNPVNGKTAAQAPRAKPTGR